MTTLALSCRRSLRSLRPTRGDKIGRVGGRSRSLRPTRGDKIERVGGRKLAPTDKRGQEGTRKLQQRAFAEGEFGEDILEIVLHLIYLQCRGFHRKEGMPIGTSTARLRAHAGSGWRGDDEYA